MAPQHTFFVTMTILNKRKRSKGKVIHATIGLANFRLIIQLEYTAKLWLPV